MVRDVIFTQNDVWDMVGQPCDIIYLHCAHPPALKVKVTAPCGQRGAGVRPSSKMAVPDARDMVQDVIYIENDGFGRLGHGSGRHFHSK